MAHRLMGGSKCNSIKAATQKSSANFSLRLYMERGVVGSFQVVKGNAPCGTGFS